MPWTVTSRRGSGAGSPRCETEYADHCGVINLFRCQAAEWMRETTVKLEHARAKLDQIRGDYEAVAARLRSDAFAGFEAESEHPGTESETDTDGDGDGHESGD